MPIDEAAVTLVGAGAGWMWGGDGCSLSLGVNRIFLTGRKNTNMRQLTLLFMPPLTGDAAQHQLYWIYGTTEELLPYRAMYSVIGQNIFIHTIL